MRRTLDDGFELDDDPQRVDVGAVHRFLSTEAYWALGRARDVVERTIHGSTRVVGLYRDDRQMGFARVVSDGMTIAYLADVYVEREARGRGLGRELVLEAVERGPQSNCRWLLHTEDPAFYEPLGFGPPTDRTRERRTAG